MPPRQPHLSTAVRAYRRSGSQNRRYKATPDGSPVYVGNAASSTCEITALQRWQRRPMSTSVDQRWDASRGIVLESPQAAPHGDFSWSPRQGIRFSHDRSFASKAGPASRPFAQSSPPSRKGAPQSYGDQSHKSASFNFADPIPNPSSANGSSPSSVTDLKAKSHQLEQDNNTLRAEIEQTVHRMSKEHVEAAARLKKHHEEETRQLQALHWDALAEHNTTIEQMQNKVKEIELARETLQETIEDIQEQLRQWKQGWETRVEQQRAEFEAEYRRKEEGNIVKIASLEQTLRPYEASLDRLKQEVEDDAAKRLSIELSEVEAREQSITQRLLEQHILHRQQLHRQQSERTDYAAYHGNFDEILLALLDVKSALEILRSVCHIGHDHCKALQGQWDLFIRNDPWFVHTYSGLNREIQRLHTQRTSNADTVARSITNQRNALRDLERDFKEISHVSRFATNQTRFNVRRWTTASAIWYAPSQLATTHRLVLLDRRLKVLEQDMNTSQTNGTYAERSRIKIMLKDTLREMEIVRRLATFNNKMRAIDSFIVLRDDTLEEKRVYLELENTRTQLRKASQLWFSYVENRPALDRQSSVSREEQHGLRREWRDRYYHAMTSMNKVESDMKKVALLETELDQISTVERHLDAEIDQRIFALIGNDEALYDVATNELGFSPVSQDTMGNAKKGLAFKPTAARQADHSSARTTLVRRHSAPYRHISFIAAADSTREAERPPVDIATASINHMDQTSSAGRAPPTPFNPSTERLRHANDEDFTDFESTQEASMMAATIADPAAEGEEAPSTMFHIPEQLLREASLASPNSNASFWRYSLYRGPDGKPPTRHYCRSFETAETQAANFLSEPILGFDLEWSTKASAKSSIKRNICLIQIASPDKIALFHVSLFRGDTPEELMPPSLRKILESVHIIKAGVNVGGDATRIRKHLGVEMQGLFELSHLFRLVKYPPEQVNKSLVSLAQQVKEILFLPLLKDEVRVSDWSKPLTVEQTEYACSDAYAGLQLFYTLEAERKRKVPMPPRPGLYELKLPILLADGKPAPTPPRKARVSAKAGEEAAEAAEDEEYVDAPEYPDNQELEMEDGSTDTSEHSAALQTRNDATDSSVAARDEVCTEPDTTTTVDSATATSGVLLKPPPHLQELQEQQRMVQQADHWTEQLRASFSDDHDYKRGSAKQSHFRAYHIWHLQSANVHYTGWLMRQPPLPAVTVSSYILEAIVAADLDFDAVRVRELLAALPSAARLRYEGIVRQADFKTS